MRHRLAILLFSCWIASGCETHSVSGIYGGPTGLTAIESPTKVEAYRVGEMQTGPLDDPATIYGFPILSEPVAVDAASARELASLLADPGSYDWERGKACVLVPGVAVRFVGATDTIDVLFCFHCDTLLAVRNGKVVAGQEGDFDPIRPKLLAIMRRLFPSDDVIQDLK